MANTQKPTYRNEQFIVTDACEAPHAFPTGTLVRLQRVSHHGDRFLFRGKDATGGTIVQWLALADVEPIAQENEDE